MAGATTIMISKDTREELRKFGSKSETYDEIIKQLMEAVENRTIYERHKRILETEEFVPLEKV